MCRAAALKWCIGVYPTFTPELYVASSIESSFYLTNRHMPYRAESGIGGGGVASGVSVFVGGGAADPAPPQLLLDDPESGINDGDGTEDPRSDGDGGDVIGVA